MTADQVIFKWLSIVLNAVLNPTGIVCVQNKSSEKIIETESYLCHNMLQQSKWRP